MNRLTFLTVTLSLFALMLLGCSGGGQAPVLPGSELNNTASVQAPQGSRTLWGLWECSMNPGGDSIDIVPLRTAMFTANVNKLLENEPGNMMITDLDLTDLTTEGLVNCTVRLRHPFVGMDQFHGFDVWGVFLHNGQSVLSYDGLTYSGGPDAGENEAVLLNADGYTRWFNFPEFDGTGTPILEYCPGALSNLPEPTAALNPYRIYADGLGEEDDYYEFIMTPAYAQDRGIYRAGEVNSRRYELKFPFVGGLPFVKFQYAVVASWEPGDPTLTGQPAEYDPFDFPSSANCDEAFYTHTDTSESTLYNDGNSAGGAFAADIEVFDWQGGIVSNLGVPNEVERIILEADFLPGGSATFTQAELPAMAMPGTENSSVFQVDISGCSPEAAGEIGFWVIVESGGMFGDSYDQGYPAEFPPNAHRAAFLRGTVEVSATGPMGLTVTAIDPDSVPFWSYVDDAVITGTLFEDGATVELRKSGENPVPGINVDFIGPTTIQCDFDLAGADSGDWDVAVINPGGEEGILAAGFSIEVWSEETDIESGGYRLPVMAERQSGPIVLASGRNDGSVRYMIFDPSTPAGTGWAGPYLLGYMSHNDIMSSLASDPTSDTLYFTSGPSPYYRYQGGTGTWESAWNPISGCRTVLVTADYQGRPHIMDNSIQSFGFIIHERATAWGVPFGGWDIIGDYFADAFNECILTPGNVIAYDSNGNMYVIYVKDRKLNPYVPGDYPRFIRVTPLPGSGWSSGFNNVEGYYDTTPLDSPALTCDPADVLHAAYRRQVPSTATWQIRYERSTNLGVTWGSESVIYEGTSAPTDGYVFLLSDSEGNLHTLYVLDDEIRYRNSADGAAWSDVEIANPSGTSLPPGTDDITPKAILTSDGILHVTWIRGNATTGFGDLCHRMRDLL